MAAARNTFPLGPHIDIIDLCVFYTVFPTLPLSSLFELGFRKTAICFGLPHNGFGFILLHSHLPPPLLPPGRGLPRRAPPQPRTARPRRWLCCTGARRGAPRTLLRSGQDPGRAQAALGAPTQIHFSLTLRIAGSPLRQRSSPPPPPLFFENKRCRQKEGGKNLSARDFY